MKTVVISLGGSIIVPDNVNAAFLRNFKKFVESFAHKGYRLAIYCGGGALARYFPKSASQVA